MKTLAILFGFIIIVVRHIGILLIITNNIDSSILLKGFKFNRP